MLIGTSDEKVCGRMAEERHELVIGSKAAKTANIARHTPTPPLAALAVLAALAFLRALYD
jgi:hypothetical protein